MKSIRRMLTILSAAIVLGMFSGVAGAGHYSASHPHATTHEKRHYDNNGGHYRGGRGSSHKGGRYKNPKTHDHYRRHVR